MRVLLGVVSLGLTACASVQPAHVDARMQAWEGVHIETLMDAWGPPDREYEAAGRQFFSWSSQRRERGGGPTMGVGVGGGGGHVGVSVGTLFGLGGGGGGVCTRSAELDQDGRVVRLRWNGDPDYCDKLTPRRTSGG
ncbi:MAG: hypothetical protein HYV16_12670 [Gammaproteobacteria bacterium]|nr:hypothetical protein [Gammaproteobacteria bacterium]